MNKEKDKKSSTPDELSLTQKSDQVPNTLTMFEQILVISSRAKDIQQIQNNDLVFDNKPGYKALKEYQADLLKPVISLKNQYTEEDDNSEEEEENTDI